MQVPNKPDAGDGLQPRLIRDVRAASLAAQFRHYPQMIRIEYSWSTDMLVMYGIYCEFGKVRIDPGACK